MTAAILGNGMPIGTLSPHTAVFDAVVCAKEWVQPLDVEMAVQGHRFRQRRCSPNSGNKGVNGHRRGRPERVCHPLAFPGCWIHL